MLKGIDISKHQGVISWEKVPKDIKFVIIRAGYGVNTVDKYFKANIEGALKNGFSVGVYWFIYANTEAEALTNAIMFDSVIKPYKDKITYKVWCDYEYDTDEYAVKCGYNPTKTTRTAIVKTFCEKMRSLGYEVGVYANRDYLRNKFEDLSKYPLWYALYSSIKDRDCYMWQYTSKGSVNGISGNVDMNYCYSEEKEELPNLEGYCGYSITQALKEKGYNNSFSYRKTLWQKLGKTTTYKGTAAQNLELLELLGANTASYYPACAKSYTSIVNGLNSVGVNSSFANRKKIAKANGITAYIGTAAQNTKLLNLLKSGTLKKI